MAAAPQRSTHPESMLMHLPKSSSRNVVFVASFDSASPTKRKKEKEEENRKIKKKEKENKKEKRKINMMLRDAYQEEGIGWRVDTLMEIYIGIDKRRGRGRGGGRLPFIATNSSMRRDSRCGRLVWMREMKVSGEASTTV